MSDQSDKRTSGSLRSASKKPFMLGYTVRPIGNTDKSAWVRIAAAWEHADGQGLEVRMDAMPLDGRLVLRTPPEAGDDRGEPDVPAPGAGNG